MGRLPPAEKLPLAIRKNIRDEWENNKEEAVTKLSELLGTEWKIEVDPLAIFPYSDGWSKDNLGQAINGYINGAISRLETFIEKHGDDGKTEINTICHAHTLTIDFDEEKRFSYCGAHVHEGQLQILFAENNLGYNVGDALEPAVLEKALNSAAPAEGGDDAALSYTVRKDIRESYDPEIGAIEGEVRETLAKDDFKLVPQFEEVYAALKGSGNASGSWEENMARYIKLYFEGLAWQLKQQKFNEDDMLQEGFNEAVEKGEARFRIVDALVRGSYNEVEIEDGVLYIQTTPDNFGVNVNDAGQKIVDLL